MSFSSCSSPIKFLICTDNHLGYNEKDPICSKDSFEAFEELLQIARDRQVDAILHCGDLFHENKPSRQTLHSTIELIRKYSLGDLPCSLEYLSDPERDFGYSCVNFQNPDINVAIPIFAIHGNHDDPVGDGNLSAWNLLAATRLVNYFGKASDLDDIRISPILLRKGNISVALYGLGNVRDERLHRSFQHQRVSFLHPLDDNENKWFNLMMIHQNRIAHSKSNYIPEEFLDPLLNLVIWGHEHESILEPQLCLKRGFHVIQPGSSVATSLCDAEAHSKYAAIICIGEGGKFAVDKIPLQSVRSFLMRDISLASLFQVRDDDAISNSLEVDQKRLNVALVAEVESILRDHHHNHTSSSQKNVKLPLVRLRVDYSGGFPTLNPQCFGHQFVGKVANPRDILHFYRRRARSCHSHEHERNSIKKESSSSDNHQSTSIISDSSIISIESVLAKNIKMTVNGDDNQGCWQILPPLDLMEKIRQFVEKDDKDAIERWINQRLASVNAKAKMCSTLGQIREKIGEIDREKAMREKIGGGMVRGFSSDDDEEEQIDSKSKIMRHV